MRRVLTIGALVLSSGAMAAEGPGLGRDATPAETSRVDISIFSDGRNLPAGTGSVAQGARIYSEKCLACHGAAGVGGPMDRLTGGIGTLTSARPVKTVASYWPYAPLVFDYIRRAMPTPAPQSLTNDEVYAVTAYILSIDGIVPQNAVMSAGTLPLVRMPNRDGFIDWSGNLVR